MEKKKTIKKNDEDIYSRFRVLNLNPYVLLYTKTVPFRILSIERVIKFPLINYGNFIDRDLLE